VLKRNFYFVNLELKTIKRNVFDFVKRKIRKISLNIFVKFLKIFSLSIKSKEFFYLIDENDFFKVFIDKFDLRDHFSILELEKFEYLHDSSTKLVDFSFEGRGQIDVFLHKGTVYLWP
jgi:hypothetical protein